MRIIFGLILWVWLTLSIYLFSKAQSSPPKVFLGKDASKICCKFTRHYPSQSMISIKLLCNFFEPHFGMGVLLWICSIVSEDLFIRTTMEDCFWNQIIFFEPEACLGLHLKIKSFATIEVVAKTSKDKELCNYRSSRPEVFFKKDILRNFTKFTGKHLSLRPATLLKKTLWQRCIPVNFVKLLRTPFLHRTPLVVASATVVNG